MKRKMFSIMAIAAIALVSCKKDDVDSTELGSATINGNLWADMDLTDSDVEGVSGMTVKIVVNTADWDQQPVVGYNYDEKVYVATTDASGDYSFTIPATDQGYNVDIEFEDYFTTRTTSSGAQDVEVTRGTITKFIYSGAVITTQDEATVDIVNSNNQAYGWATVKGDVNVTYDIANWNAPAPLNQKLTTAAAAANLGAQDVVWMYDYSPYGGNDQTVYSVAVDLTDGTYELTVGTESLSTGNDIAIYYGMMDFEASRIQNNMAGTQDTLYDGYYSVGGLMSYYDYLYDGDIIYQDINLGFTAY